MPKVHKISVDTVHASCYNSGMKHGRMPFYKAVLAALVTLFSLVADAMTPGGIEKKYVGLLFDVMKTTPSNILANADQFAEHAPYLDGVAISLNAVPVVGPDGTVVTSKLSRIMDGSERWTRDALRDQIPVLREIAAKPGLKESFLLFWMTPHDRESRLAWTDDKAWTNYAENMAAVSWLAKVSGMKGLMLDPEEYASALQYVHSPQDPPFPETAKLARQRGREVFSRVFKEYPDVTLFTLWYFGKFRRWLETGRQPHPAALIDDAGELLQYFYNGMLDVMPPEARVVDGCEHYSLSATKYQYLYNAIAQTTGALAFVAPENQAKYKSQLLVGNTHFLDMFTQDANPKGHWYHGPVDGSRLEHLRLNLEQSLLTATEYVWLYGENGGKLFNWRDGHFAKQKTWEEAIPGITETLMLVKDPERLAAMRREKLAAEGALVNLVANARPVKLENPAESHKYSQDDGKMPSVKGVRPGERYLVGVQVRTFFGKKGGEGRPGAACPHVIWRKNGKRAAQAVPLAVPENAGRESVRAEGIVTVPDGADELLLDLAAELSANENVHYMRPSVCNAFDPVTVEAAAPAHKWEIDLKNQTLTDGHWKLRASMHKERLFVYGDGTNTVGGGVLDLRNVKADTGHEIFELGRFGGYTDITALIAPDVPSIATRAFSGCDNLKAVVIGDLPLMRKADSDNEKRIDRLSRLGIRKELVDGRTRVGFSHPSVAKKSFGSEIAAKGLKPGELYNVGVSMRRSGAGEAYIGARFRSQGRDVGAKCFIGMKQPREDGVWRDGDVVMRVPEGADEICFDIYAKLNTGTDTFEFDKFAIYKIGDPLPKWPAEAERPKQ